MGWIDKRGQVRPDVVMKMEAPLQNPKDAYDSVKDSGAREQFASGAVRDTQDGKPRPDRALMWLPLEALERVSTHYENGAKKYDRDNWRKGIPASRCLASAFRHLLQWMRGDRGEDHLSAVVFNVFCIITWEQLGRTELLDTLMSASPKDEQPADCRLNRRGFNMTRRLPGGRVPNSSRRTGWGRRFGDMKLHCTGAV